MPVDHTEKGFEQAIEDHLIQHGYRKGGPAKCDAALVLTLNIDVTKEAG